MAKGKGNVYRIVLVAVLVVAFAMLFFENASAITGHAVDKSVQSNVTIRAFFSVAWSTDLNDGIVFEDVLTLPTTDQNATHNYDKVGNSTGYYVTVHPDSNRDVDFCLRANGDLTTGPDNIGLGNETYTTNVTSSDGLIPNVTLQSPMTTVYNKSTTNVGAGEVNYYRFWLDIPAAQAPGTYVNAVDFRGAVSGSTNSTCVVP